MEFDKNEEYLFPEKAYDPTSLIGKEKINKFNKFSKLSKSDNIFNNPNKKSFKKDI